jgi:murein DD-endopeptidase MepM/ murein hydrolase activator NlpD
MAKHKYRFNPESLSFDKVIVGHKAWIFKVLTYFFAGAVIAIAYNFIFASFFDSPRERMLRRENEQMKLQYEIITQRMEQMDGVLKDLQKRDDNIYRTVFEAEPIPLTVREAGFGGVNRYASLEGYNNSNLIISTSKKLDVLTKKAYVQSKSYDEIIALAKKKGEMLMAIPSIQPVSNKDLTCAASGWGWRIHPIYKIKKFHTGMDFTSPVGSDIYATGNGVVETVETAYRGYGLHVIINHGFGYKTLYAHMSKVNVHQGEHVKRGDIIGYVGNSGLSTGPHLHYEVIKGGEKVNPMGYYFNDLTPAQYENMIQISSASGQTFD